MEQQLGLPLLLRNSRSVELTESGRQFFERCEFIVEETENACETLLQDARNPTGWVRLSLTAEIFHAYLREAVTDFVGKYPGIQLNVHFSNYQIDLLTDPFDLALRAGRLPDSGLKARKLHTISTGIFASPAFLNAYPSPAKPDDLTALPCISFSFMRNRWKMRKGTRTAQPLINPSHIVNSANTGMYFVLGGLGISILPIPMATPHEQSGDLVRLLPDWTTPTVDMHILMADGRMPKRVRLFVDYLVEYFAKLPK